MKEVKSFLFIKLDQEAIDRHFSLHLFRAWGCHGHLNWLTWKTFIDRDFIPSSLILSSIVSSIVKVGCFAIFSSMGKILFVNDNLANSESDEGSQFWIKFDEISSMVLSTSNLGIRLTYSVMLVQTHKWLRILQYNTSYPFNTWYLYFICPWVSCFYNISVIRSLFILFQTFH